ncbi:p-loop domain-containing protein [Desulfonema limicola]|uniref:P-loop domain-containing protein n=1 Tax=Desulfonema limicola TaxID=45656 RepID=A0A975BD72_9BACT|nr:cobalamin biosynthesis protein CbiA [Desulfonema limicola]QTA83118.1 p-loop domain-containing protein [Desulfonema limicola]
MKINLNGIVIIVGNYGSGKTEVAVNLAINRKQAGLDVRLADLDLVNPYFRSREARDVLTRLGIELVLPPDQYMNADLPILSPAVAGMLHAPSELALVDAGGDDAGATVLAALAHVLKGKDIRVLQVVNPYRPFTDTIQGCIKIRREIEYASKLMINGIIGNANLIDETTSAEINKGYDFVKNLSKQTLLPLEFITSDRELIPKLDLKRFSCPVLPVSRQLVPPWKKAGVINSSLV